MKVESRLIEQRDLEVVMRDGTRLAVDVYRPPEPGKYPVLYASALHNKDIQGPDIADVLPVQPAHAPLWFGPIEAGDTRRFVANGYVHVIAPVLHRLGGVRLYLQAALARRAALLPERQGAEEIAVHRARPSRASVPPVP